MEGEQRCAWLENVVNNNVFTLESYRDPCHIGHKIPVRTSRQRVRVRRMLGVAPCTFDWVTVRQ